MPGGVEVDERLDMFGRPLVLGSESRGDELVRFQEGRLGILVAIQFLP